jgi:hypothetical protein
LKPGGEISQRSRARFVSMDTRVKPAYDEGKSRCDRAPGQRALAAAQALYSAKTLRYLARRWR